MSREEDINLSIIMTIESLKFSSEAVEAMSENPTFPDNIKEKASKLSKDIEDFLDALFEAARETLEDPDLMFQIPGDDSEC